MFDISWNAEKSRSLRDRYGIGFEEVVTAISEGGLLKRRKHPNVEKYPHQMQLILRINAYAYVVPYVEDEKGIFLKTLYPSRKAKAESKGS